MTSKKIRPIKAEADPHSDMIVFDVEQGTEEWFACRLGLPTASVFSTVMAQGKDGGVSITRTKLLHKLAAEQITGELSADDYRSASMDRGNVMEPVIIESYARRKKVDVRRVGFVRNFSGLKMCGASPDGLIGFDGGVEAKSAEPQVLIPLLQRPSLPPEHRAQVQGNMMVCERDWWDVTIFCHRKMPAVDVRVYREDLYIKDLSDQIERFNWELKKLVEQLRNMGEAG
jgi:hypothetical protein